MRSEITVPFLIAQGYSPTVLERFWKWVEITNSCWLWTKPTKSRYGYVWCGKSKSQLAHIFSFFIHVGPVPYNKRVLHNCPGGDNPKCVNPAHLWLGTQQDNLLDALKKERLPRHEARWNFKLTPALCEQSKALYPSMTLEQIAIHLHVSKTSVWRALREAPPK